MRRVVFVASPLIYLYILNSYSGPRYGRRLCIRLCVLKKVHRISCATSLKVDFEVLASPPRQLTILSVGPTR